MCNGRLTNKIYHYYDCYFLDTFVIECLRITLDCTLQTNQIIEWLHYLDHFSKSTGPLTNGPLLIKT